jgi:hypothetical protein
LLLHALKDMIIPIKMAYHLSSRTGPTLWFLCVSDQKKGLCHITKDIKLMIIPGRKEIVFFLDPIHTQDPHECINTGYKLFFVI